MNFIKKSIGHQDWPTQYESVTRLQLTKPHNKNEHTITEKLPVEFIIDHFIVLYWHRYEACDVSTKTIDGCHVSNSKHAEFFTLIQVKLVTKVAGHIDSWVDRMRCSESPGVVMERINFLKGRAHSDFRHYYPLGTQHATHHFSAIGWAYL